MEKYLITILGRYGDLILATPIFEAIKKQKPNATIDVIAGRNNNQVLIDNPFINNIIIYDKSPLKLIRFIFQDMTIILI